MLAMAAARLGYRTIYARTASPIVRRRRWPTRQIVAAYDNAFGLEAGQHACAVVTYEFENVPVAAADALEKNGPVYPAAKARCKSRRTGWSKRRFLNDRHSDRPFRASSTTTGNWPGRSREGRRRRAEDAPLGYDGKGQRVFRDAGPESQLMAPSPRWAACPLILEELRPVRARNFGHRGARHRWDGRGPYDPAENVHRNGILAYIDRPATTFGHAIRHIGPPRHPSRSALL
jgi:5-(carboxyamino)imidazole ribonucleotide synthase